MTARDQGENLSAAMQQPVTDWLDSADFTTGPRQVSIVFSARMPADWTDEIMAEVARRRLANPSQLIKSLVREGLDRVSAGEVVDPDVIEALGHLDAVRRKLIERRAA
jgi:hypothetical protein